MLKFTKDKKGSVVIEAAFMLPLFLIFVLGIVEFGRLYWVRSSMQLAVTEAGRYVMIHTTANDATLTSVATSSLYGLNPANFTLSFSNATNAGINYKVVTAVYNYNFITHNILGTSAITLTASSKVPILQ